MAHEMFMVMAALTNSDDELLYSPYEVMSAWERTYGQYMRVCLPDTFGTQSFFAHAPGWVADWAGMRADSMEPAQAATLYETWLKSRGRDPLSKRFIASDGLECADMPRLQKEIGNRFRLGFGWGTALTNDFRSSGIPGLKPISLVCKVSSANGRPAVKLSDNPLKATGPADEVARYMRVFGVNSSKQTSKTVTF